ncbi:alpha-1D adrenergic receptor-like [Engraulis encrasicolus]|uniref:alpha-1D adrenergic receptor-like n=1 Tax=Engraulis encrasicolus TaxID=184585 RepID=UPI002FCF5D94
MASLLATFITVATFGNTLVILSVLSNRRLQTATNLFICNLAVADLLVSVCVLPFSATLEVLGCWPFGRTFCDVWAALDVLCCSASILSLCAIAVDRYVGVRHSLHYRSLVTRHRATVVLVCVWVVCAALSSPPLLGWKEPRSPNSTVCTVTQEPGYAIFSSLLSFYLPLVVLLSVYAQVYVVARRTTLCLERGVKRERQQGWGSGGGGGGIGSDGPPDVVLRIHRRGAVLGEEIAGGTRGLHARLMLRFTREKKAAKTLAMVVGGFVLCWLPFFIVLPLSALFPTLLKPTDAVFKVVFWLGYSNSCINPFIYPCSNREFRRAFVELLRVPSISRRTNSSSFIPPLNIRKSSKNRTQQPRKWNLFRILCLQESITKLNDAAGDCSERHHCGHKAANERTACADCTQNATDSLSRENSSESS